MSETKNVKISVAGDEMKAFISIHPDESKKTISIDFLIGLLKDYGVVFGIKKEVLAILSAKYNHGHIIENILVAEGIAPFAGVEPAVQYKFERSHTPKVDESGKTDYREIDKFLNITKDQLLAIKRPLQPPVTGVTITGKKTEFNPISDIRLIAGDNVEPEEQGELLLYKATCDGALRFEHNILTVLATLDIKQDVDFKVGNIHFKGDVKIGRDVLPDFVVEATGKISLWGSAIACELSAGDDIEVRAGIVGKNKGSVCAGGNIIATFAENASIEAVGNITIKNGIIGSNVKCDGKLTVDARRSRVVGSTLRAARGISTFNVGSRFDTGTVLITGINPEKELEYFKVKSTLDVRWAEAKELEKRYGRATLESKQLNRNSPSGAQRDFNKYEFLKKQVKKMLLHLKKLEDLMYDYKATIKVKETLFPRVQIKIGKHKLTTVKEYYTTTVRYSEEEGRIIIS
ncbi:MAG: DUF342 domain-containing protein [bacterium]|nr:DUF342 domain-containing protein [bacterium]